jgi:hypothetical protein
VDESLTEEEFALDIAEPDLVHGLRSAFIG